MATADVCTLLRRLTRGMAAEVLQEQSDRQLVARLLAGRDEAAFEAVVRRHGPMVYRVCWRVLQQEQDSEDAFQATFLILAQRLHSVRRQASLASWLHGVARRVALKARSQAATRRRHERQAAPEFPPAEMPWRELRAVLDVELDQLAEKWRLPLILCYLEGRTQDEAARQLGWSERTLRRRLEEGRGALRRRLLRRGVAWPAALSAVLLSECAAAAAIAPRLLGSTVEAAACLVAGRAVATAAVSAKVAALTEGVLKTMFPSKVKICAAALVLLAAVVTASGLLYPSHAAEPPPSARLAKFAIADADKSPAKLVIAKDDGVFVDVAWAAGGKTVATNGYTVEVVEDKNGMKAGLASHSIKLWNATTGKLERSLGEEKDVMLQGISFSQDKQTAALIASKLSFDRAKGEQTAPPELEVRVVDARSWELKHKFTHGSDKDDVEMTVGTIALSPDGKRLALGGAPRLSSVNAPVPQPGEEPPGCLKLWDVANHKLIERKPKDGEAALKMMMCLAFSPDGSLIAAGDRAGNVRLFDGHTGEPKAVLKQDDSRGMVYRIAFSPDGKTLASASQDHQEPAVKLWDVQEKKLRHTLKGMLRAFAFSPDSKLLATGGGHQRADGWSFEVTLWDAMTGQAKKTMSVNVPVVSLAFSPDGKTLAVAGGLMGDVKDGAKTSGEMSFIPLE